MKRPQHTGMRHIALYVTHFEATCAFYQEVLGMHIEWQPDPDNIYLSSGHDNLALHRRKAEHAPCSGQGALDHLGFIVPSEDEVDHWYAWFQQHAVTIKNQPRSHRDGARSFYACDPDGNVLQMIYHPPLA